MSSNDGDNQEYLAQLSNTVAMVFANYLIITIYALGDILKV